MEFDLIASCCRIGSGFDGHTGDSPGRISS